MSWSIEDEIWTWQKYQFLSKNEQSYKLVFVKNMLVYLKTQLVGPYVHNCFNPFVLNEEVDFIICRTLDFILFYQAWFHVQ